MNSFPVYEEGDTTETKSAKKKEINLKLQKLLNKQYPKKFIRGNAGIEYDVENIFGNRLILRAIFDSTDNKYGIMIQTRKKVRGKEGHYTNDRDYDYDKYIAKNYEDMIDYVHGKVVDLGLEKGRGENVTSLVMKREKDRKEKEEKLKLRQSDDDQNVSDITNAFGSGMSSLISSDNFVEVFCILDKNETFAAHGSKRMFGFQVVPLKFKTIQGLINKLHKNFTYMNQNPPFMHNIKSVYREGDDFNTVSDFKLVSINRFQDQQMYMIHYLPEKGDVNCSSGTCKVEEPQHNFYFSSDPELLIDFGKKKLNKFKLHVASSQRDVETTPRKTGHLQAVRESMLRKIIKEELKKEVMKEGLGDMIKTIFGGEPSVNEITKIFLFKNHRARKTFQALKEIPSLSDKIQEYIDKGNYKDALKIALRASEKELQEAGVSMDDWKYLRDSSTEIFVAVKNR